MIINGGTQFSRLHDECNTYVHGLLRVVLSAFLFVTFGLKAPMAFASGSGTAGNPFTTLSDAYSVSSGRYYFNTGSGVFQADVDNSDGGGWVLILQYVRNGGTNPALSVIGAGANLPVTSTASLGTDESADTMRWGHTGNAAMSQFTGDIELKWYGQTSNHGRVIHFRSSVGDDYVRTGTGSFAGIDSAFTALSGHSANLPAATTNHYVDKTDYALTNFPYWKHGNYHWAVRGEEGSGSGDMGDRWEVDDTSKINSTIHRVWVRSVDTGTIVTHTNDSGVGSLRQAILNANASPSEDDIRFNIPGVGPHKITPLTSLPKITDDGVSLDGTSQSGASCGQLSTGTPHTLMIELDGSSAASARGLTVNADNVTLKGLAITHFDSHGISSQASIANYLTVDCNYVGVEANGTIRAPNSALSGNNFGIYLTSDSNLILRNNVVSGHDTESTITGVGLFSVMTATLEGNIIGLDATGTSALGNGGSGVIVSDSTNVTIGGTTGARRNVISDNTDNIRVENGSNNITIIGNYLGTDVTGLLPRGPSARNIEILNNTTNMIQIGGEGVGEGNVIADAGDDQIHNSHNSQNITILGNYIGVGADGLTAFGANDGGIAINGAATGIVIGNGTVAGANIIANNNGDGIRVNNTNAEVAIVANMIYNNGSVAIDLDNDGTTFNDVGDGDTGPNELLNFPVINSFSANGTVTVFYDVTLDVPTHGNGYRIEFFSNSAADASGYGEGEVYLGFVDMAGSGTYTGSFTSIVAVSAGTIISATMTRKTGATSYDITSEFSANKVSVETADPLIVTSTADTDTLGTLRYAINHANANTGDDNITFNIPGAGPHVIALSSYLPIVTDADVSIDGTTQDGAMCGDLWGGTPHTLKIEINGSRKNVFNLQGASVTIKGVAITNANYPVVFQSTSTNGVLQCTYIGMAPDGTTNRTRITAVLLDGSSDTLIGGLSTGEGNVIGASKHGIVSRYGASGMRVRGNFVGTDPTGLTARPITVQTISARGNVTWSDITKNLISGNTGLNPIGTDGNESITGESGDVLIQGNYIGVDRTGNTALPNSSDGINFVSGSISGVTIGGINPGDRNVISGNAGGGIVMSGIDNVTILGNYIGTNATGTAAIVNMGALALSLPNATNLTIGNGTAAGRNIMHSDATRLLHLSGTISNVSINDNYFGVDVTGNTALTGTVIDHLYLENTTNLSVLNNVFGPMSQESFEIRAGSSTGLKIQGNHFGVGADGTSALPGGRSLSGWIWFDAAQNATDFLIGGAGAGEGNLIANGVGSGIDLDSDDTISGQIIGNTIHSNAYNGISINNTASVVVSANRIYANGDLGIDIASDGVTSNDNGDGDAGPNDRLNFPVLNSIVVDGTTLIEYDLTLDVPVNANGYRIEFFKSTTVDDTGYGEGETYLGFIDVAGSGTFASTFTALTTVDPNEHISATTTQKTASGFNKTSEFSLSYTSALQMTELSASKSVEVFDPNNTGLYALPGNDVVSSLTIANIGEGVTDADTLIMIDKIPSEMTFYNGDVDDAGPETQPVSFAQTGGAGLSFNYSTDVKFSNSGTRPANFSACTYTPSPGYDVNVTFICVNPKGAMQAGDPDPTVTVAFRAKIK